MGLVVRGRRLHVTVGNLLNNSRLSLSYVPHRYCMGMTDVSPLERARPRGGRAIPHPASVVRRGLLFSYLVSAITTGRRSDTSVARLELLSSLLAATARRQGLFYYASWGAEPSPDSAPARSHASTGHLRASAGPEARGGGAQAPRMSFPDGRERRDVPRNAFSFRQRYTPTHHQIAWFKRDPHGRGVGGDRWHRQRRAYASKSIVAFEVRASAHSQLTRSQRNSQCPSACQRRCSLDSRRRRSLSSCRRHQRRHGREGARLVGCRRPHELRARRLQW